jgi:AhpD family alkylhydroperoxidase
MAVVTPLPEDQAPLLAKPFYAGGDPGPITAALAHVPELLEVALPFLGAILSPSAIDFRTKEIVILRTSALLACRYCIDSHTPVALDSGLAAEQVRALRNEQGFDPSDRFTDQRDRALIAWNDEVAGKTGAVPTAIGTEMSRHLGEGTITRLSADGFERAA